MRLLGCDVGAEFIIIHDGKTATKITTPLEAQAYIKNSDVVILEQTGAYGVRWCELFQSLGAKVYIADGRDFKSYRNAYSRKKDDATDALYLIQYYKEKPHKCRPYNPQQVHIRALIRQHLRNQKDITQHANRLRQYLAVIYPTEELYNSTRHRLFKNLSQLIQRLKETPHALSPLALSEAQKLSICLQEAQHLQEEIISIARNHPDYEILKTFVGLGELTIATLLAYSWDISTFKSKDSYIAYVLMGTTLEQSGKSINR
ncbi:MAG: transposase, partial [Candidatus Calescibacterium sp.]|nr:transposase [Candidatus Calescibacterium sp.]